MIDARDDLAVFLASDQAGHITGEAINSTGGQEMHRPPPRMFEEENRWR